MAKTGNSHLRSALYRMAVVGTQHNPIIKEHYRRKRVAGKAPMNAIGHCMAKALAIVWGVWRSGQDFDPKKRSPKHLTRPMGSNGSRPRSRENQKLQGCSEAH